MSRSRVLKTFVFGLIFTVMGCSEHAGNASGTDPETAEGWADVLSGPEEFVWDDQPISFSPPPEDWERQKEQSGGLLGARFVKYVSGGQSIHVAEVTDVGRRDRCSELKSLISELEEMTPREFAKSIQRARPDFKDSINRSEQDAFEAALSRLGDAQTAYRSKDLDEAESRLSAALWDLRFVKYSLDDVVGSAMFKGEGYDAFGEVNLAEPVRIEVGGQEALSLDFRVERGANSEETIHGRKVYVEHNNRLFEASFQGVEAYRPLFDAMLASIAFPVGPCEH